VEEVGQTYELESRKARITITRPFQIGIAVYQLAKLRMLEFYYDFLDRYLDRSDFKLIQMDTDSNYIAISAERLEGVPRQDQCAQNLRKKARVAGVGQVERAHAWAVQTRMRRQPDDCALREVLLC